MGKPTNTQYTQPVVPQNTPPVTIQSSTTLRLPTQDSSTGRALKSFVQAVIGFSVGLFTTIWAVPGVSEVTVKYCQDHFMLLAISLGVPTALASFVWNCLRKDVANY